MSEGALLPQKPRRSQVVRPPIGLLLSIGDTTTSRGGKEIPEKIDHFRPKPGRVEQFAAAAARFWQVYGAEPKQLSDLVFLSNSVGELLDVRVRWWGASRLKGVGLTNFATITDPQEFEERVNAWDDDIQVWLEDKPAPIFDRLQGPDDPRIEKYQMAVEATLSFCLPEVMGLGTVAQITTKSRRSRRNLYYSCWDFWRAFQGQLVGVPFRLSVRPAQTNRFDKEKRRWVPADFYELVLDTSLTLADIFARLRERRDALGGSRTLRPELPPGDDGGSARRVLGRALDGLPVIDVGDEALEEDEPLVVDVTEFEDSPDERIPEPPESGDGSLLTIPAGARTETDSERLA